MPADDYKTVSDELIHVADSAREFFVDRGYDVDIEKRELGFPMTPTLLCRRNHETLIVEVVAAVEPHKIERWLRYAHSQRADTRVWIILRLAGAVPPEMVEYARDSGVGLSVHNDERLMEVRATQDLALNVQLPDLKDLPKPVRRILAPSFEKFASNDWRDGLFGAYAEVEQLAKQYLKHSLDSGRAKVFLPRRKGAAVELRSQDVDHLTLGRLRLAFANIQNQNQRDSTIAATLSIINAMRNGLAHNRRARDVENQIRQEAGNHMYAVIACLEELAA